VAHNGGGGVFISFGALLLCGRSGKMSLTLSKYICAGHSIVGVFIMSILHVKMHGSKMRLDKC
jgi:hypothetical protein